LGRLASRLNREGISGVTLIHGEPGDPKLPPAAIDLAILAHMYDEIENPYEFLNRLRPSFAPNARLAIVDLDKSTQDHGTPPALLRCELAAVGYRQVDFVLLTPADGYLAIFVPPDALPPVEAIRAAHSGAHHLTRVRHLCRMPMMSSCRATPDSASRHISQPRDN